MANGILDLQKRKEFQDRIGYHFKEEERLVVAFTHSSYVNELVHNKKKSHNERMEFLGDAILELIVSDYLYQKYIELSEGKLSKLRASLVCEPSLALCARELCFGELLLLGKGESKTGGRDRDSILSDAFEAVIGSIYLDGGLAKASSFVHQHCLQKLNDNGAFIDNKSRLQEYLLTGSSGSLSYELIKEEGPDHEKLFTIQLVFNGKPLAIGQGSSKKAAEQEAAKKALSLFTNTSKT